MKKAFILILLCLILTGCGSIKNYKNVTYSVNNLSGTFRSSKECFYEDGETKTVTSKLVVDRRGNYALTLNDCYNLIVSTGKVSIDSEFLELTLHPKNNTEDQTFLIVTTNRLYYDDENHTVYER